MRNGRGRVQDHKERPEGRRYWWATHGATMSKRYKDWQQLVRPDRPNQQYCYFSKVLVRLVDHCCSWVFWLVDHCQASAFDLLTRPGNSALLCGGVGRYEVPHPGLVDEHPSVAVVIISLG